MKYRTMKVFDCQDMPEALRYKFLDLWDDKGNDSSVEWTVRGDIYEGDDDVNKLIDDWLIENGAEFTKTEHTSGEEVIIKYWW